MNEQYKIDPLTGNPVEYTVTPPQPSSLVSPFGDKSIGIGNAVMGTIEQRQESLGKNTPFFKKSCGSYKK